eukprot:g15.t1
MDAKRFTGAAERNAAPILKILKRYLPQLLPGACRVLELASGTGQHSVRVFAESLGHAVQPSDPEPESVRSIACYRSESAASELVRAPLQIDVLTEPAEWGVEPGAFDYVFNCNMVHISPWATTAGLFRGARHAVREDGGLVVMYGPFSVDGEMVDSNRAFDASLRARDSSWGVRELREVEAVAAAAGFALRERVPMPANNFMLFFQRNA